jgi:hypothetical protein
MAARCGSNSLVPDFDVYDLEVNQLLKQLWH